MTPTTIPMPTGDTALTPSSIYRADGSIQYVKAVELNAQHPWHKEMLDLWTKLDLLYEGGKRMEDNAGLFLVRKAKELNEIYTARSKKFSYQNILAQGIDWYVSYLFRTRPEIDCLSADGKDLQPDPWYADWQKNVDRKRSSDLSFFRDAFSCSLRNESAWILLDLPNLGTKPSTLAEQQAGGQVDSKGNPMPYLVCYEPRQVVNWAEDDAGNLSWVLIHTEGEVQRFLDKPLMIDRWYYFDRQTYKVYERSTVKGKQSAYAQLIDEGPHLMADRNIVPVYRLRVPSGLWLANRVYTQVQEHLNTDNTFGWALFCANLSMPVISGDMKEVPTLSEAGYLKLPKDCILSWTEPPGNSYVVSERRLETLREEILRQMYLQYQARSNAATPAMQSGYSKEIEMMPAADIANRFAQVVRDCWEWVLNAVAMVRGEEYTWGVRGMQFTEAPVVTELETALGFKQLAVPSESAEKENYVAAALVRFRDSSGAVKDKIAAEIRAAPSDAEKQQQMFEQANQFGMNPNAPAGAPPAQQPPSEQPK